MAAINASNYVITTLLLVGDKDECVDAVICGCDEHRHAVLLFNWIVSGIKGHHISTLVDCDGKVLLNKELTYNTIKELK